MFTLIRNIDLYAPAPFGSCDILICGTKIIAIEDSIKSDALPGPCEILYGDSCIALPGFIDGHVHILGGGGEGGFATRMPELKTQDAFIVGVTTVVGTLGTDGITRSMESLVAKTYSLREEGLSAWCLSGSYRVPPRTVTGDLMKDIMLIDPIIGAGEIAISDHRSSKPSLEELSRIASEARVAGMLSGKAGIVNVHLGDAPGGLKPLEDIVAAGDMPKSQFIPTHCNRNPSVFNQSIAWARKDGYIDITTSTTSRFIDEGETAASVAIRRLRDAGVPLERVSCTSDGQGSLPVFDESGKMQGITVGTCASLWEAVRASVVSEEVPLEEALKTITSTPAEALKLKYKGRIKIGNDADITIISRDKLHVHTVIANGRVVVKDGKALQNGFLKQ